MPYNQAGKPPTRAELDNAVGSVTRQLHVVLGNAMVLKDVIDSIGQDNLKAVPYGYTEDEAYLLALAFEKIAALQTTYANGAPPAQAYDYEGLTLPLRGISF